MVRNGPSTKKSIAKKAGVSVNQLGSYMMGRSFPDDETIRKLAIALECTIDDLFDETYDPWNFGSSED